LLALMLARNLDGGPDRSAVIGLQAGGRYLLCPDELSPAGDDRPHKDVLTLRDLSAGTPASEPP
jgi:hypothetical protein